MNTLIVVALCCACFGLGHWFGYWYGRWTVLQARIHELKCDLLDKPRRR